MRPLKFTFYLLIVVAITLGVSLVAQNIIAAVWVPPSANPPTNNLSEFINASTTPQGKLGNFGVGTQSPNSKLHVYQDSGNNAEIDIQSNAGANTHWGIYHDRIGATNDLRFWNNSVPGDKNALTIKTNGYIGIGTTTPNSKLVVAGQVQITGGAPGNGKVLLSDNNGVGSWVATSSLGIGGSITWPLLSTIDGTTAAPAYSWSADPNMGFRRGGTDDLRLVTNGADNLTITSAGSVGIGTTANIVGKFQVNPQASTEGIRIISASDWSPLNIRNNANSVDLFRVDQTGTLATGSVPWARLTSFPAACGGGMYVSAIGSSLTCSTPAGLLPGGTSGYTLRYDGANWVSNNIIFNNGTNVGIGTPAPGTSLHVNLPTQTTASINSLLISRWTRPQTSAVKWGNSMDILLGSYGTSVNSQSRVDFKLADGATDLPDTTVMTLQGNGNVGINTISPGAKLHVADGTVLFSSGVANHTRIHASGDGYGGAAPLVLSGDPVASTGFSFVKGIADYNGTPSTKFEIDGSGGGYFLGNVGIGDASPASLLSVGSGDLFQVNSAGNIVKVNNVTYSWPAAQGAASTVLTNNGAGTLTWSAAGSGLPAGTSGYTLRYDGTNWISNNTIFNNGTNVGIGTTSPSYKLDVSGALRASTNSRLATTDIYNDNIEFNAANSGNRYAFIDFHGDDTYSDYGLRIIRGNAGANASSEIDHRGTGDLIINAVDAAALKLRTASADRLTILSTGNVGIGTTNPGNKLHVSGTGSTWIQVSDTGQTSGAFFGMEAGVTKVMSSGNGIALRTDGGGWSDKLFVTNAGNVGIGTTGPRNGLELAKLDSNYITSLRVGGILQGNTGAAVGAETSRHQILFSSWRDAFPDTVGAKVVAININQLSPALVQYTDLAFYTLGVWPGGSDSTTEKMRITSSGNVGIGTTGPGDPLTVVGSITVDNNNTNAGTAANFLRFGGSSGEGIASKRNAGGNQYGLDFYTGSINRISITNGGNVGIGVTSPEGKLHLVKDASLSDETTYAIKILPTTGDPAIGMLIGPNSANNIGIIQAYDPYTSWGGRSLVFQPNGGNVGIGTTNPGAKLEVAGQVKITGGTPGTGKVLVDSDGSGLASWQSVSISRGCFSSCYATGSGVWTACTLLKDGVNVCNDANGCTLEIIRYQGTTIDTPIDVNWGHYRQYSSNGWWVSKMAGETGRYGYNGDVTSTKVAEDPTCSDLFDDKWDGTSYTEQSANQITLNNGCAGVRVELFICD